MHVIAFNGSPRKKWNTATLLEKALEGAASQGADTDLIHLWNRVWGDEIVHRALGVPAGLREGVCNGGEVRQGQDESFPGQLSRWAGVIWVPAYRASTLGLERFNLRGRIRRDRP